LSQTKSGNCGKNCTFNIRNRQYDKGYNRMRQIELLWSMEEGTKKVAVGVGLANLAGEASIK